MYPRFSKPGPTLRSNAWAGSGMTPLLMSGQQTAGMPTAIGPPGSGVASGENDDTGEKPFGPAKFEPTVSG